jgi:hypothetical protein
MNAETTAKAVETLMNATNLTASAALAEVKKANETAAVAEQGAQLAPEKTPSKKGASQKKGAPKAKKSAKVAKSKAKAAAPKKEAKASKKAAKPASKKAAVAVPRESSKKAIILDLLQRKQGGTLAEIMKATGWQAHSIRGYVSGTLMKKMDLQVESFRNALDERTYRIR